MGLETVYEREKVPQYLCNGVGKVSYPVRETAEKKRKEKKTCLALTCPNKHYERKNGSPALYLASIKRLHFRTALCHFDDPRVPRNENSHG